MKKVKTEKQMKEDFIKEYKALCKKYKYELTAYPQWMRDDRNAWFTVIQLTVQTMV